LTDFKYLKGTRL